MKIICAGFPKTGTKTASAALRELGFNVCDYMDMIENMTETWADFIHNNGQIEQVLSEYDRLGFDANQVTVHLKVKT